MQDLRLADKYAAKFGKQLDRSACQGSHNHRVADVVISGLILVVHLSQESNHKCSRKHLVNILREASRIR